MNLYKLFSYSCTFLLGVGVMHNVSAVEANAPTAIDECSKELLIAYFPEAFVNETFKKFNVPQDKWNSINKDLAGKEKEVVKIVEEKAEKLSPNPLKDPSQRQAAVKIFRETLLQIFSEALKKNGVNDDKQIQAMLDDVQQQKARRFAQCMEKHKSQMQQQAPQAQKSPQARNNQRSSDGQIAIQSDSVQQQQSSADESKSASDTSDDDESSDQDKD